MLIFSMSVHISTVIDLLNKHIISCSKLYVNNVITKYLNGNIDVDVNVDPFDITNIFENIHVINENDTKRNCAIFELNPSTHIILLEDKNTQIKLETSGAIKLLHTTLHNCSWQLKEHRELLKTDNITSEQASAIMNAQKQLIENKKIIKQATCDKICEYFFSTIHGVHAYETYGDAERICNKFVTQVMNQQKNEILESLQCSLKTI